MRLYQNPPAKSIVAPTSSANYRGKSDPAVPLYQEAEVSECSHDPVTNNNAAILISCTNVAGLGTRHPHLMLRGSQWLSRSNVDFSPLPLGQSETSLLIIRIVLLLLLLC